MVDKIVPTEGTKAALEEQLKALDDELKALESQAKQGTTDEILARARLIGEVRDRRDQVQINLSAVAASN